MQTQKEVVRLFFYNLAEFVFEYFRDSPAETSARLLQSFFFHSNRPRSIYQYSNMLRGFREKIVTF